MMPYTGVFSGGATKSSIREKREFGKWKVGK